MSKIYNITLPCGCLLSSFEESLIPCSAGLPNLENEVTQDDLDQQMLHNLSWQRYNQGLLSISKEAENKWWDEFETSQAIMDFRRSLR